MPPCRLLTDPLYFVILPMTTESQTKYIQPFLVFQMPEIAKHNGETVLHSL